uniref:Uncharacterized protein n=1 Tax=Anguilla anguilla TaxID=7936 RepID=A0A0E9SWK2_ANGAN
MKSSPKTNGCKHTDGTLPRERFQTANAEEAPGVHSTTLKFSGTKKKSNQKKTKTTMLI